MLRQHRPCDRGFVIIVTAFEKVRPSAFHQTTLDICGRPRSGGLEELGRDGLVRMRNGVIEVTREGRAFVRAVAATFDTYLQAGATRHAAAI